MKRFRMVAGPNGSGKTTLRRQLAADYAVNFYETLNADEIFAEVADTGVYAPRISVDDAALRTYAESSSYDAEVKSAFRDGRVSIRNEIVEFETSAINSYTVALLTGFLMSEYLRQGVSLSLETVFSHPSKIDALRLAQEAGFRTYLYFVATENAALNAERIANRAALGGHDVPTEKITSRFARSLSQVPKALPLLSRAYFFDNSGETMRVLAEWDGERREMLRASEEPLPIWFTSFADACELRQAETSHVDRIGRSAAEASCLAVRQAFAAGLTIPVMREGRLVRLAADGTEHAIEEVRT